MGRSRARREARIHGERALRGGREPGPTAVRAGTVAGMSEWQLLRRYATRRDEAAFEALVARHGPMVLGDGRRDHPGVPVVARARGGAASARPVGRRSGDVASIRPRHVAVVRADAPGKRPAGRPPLSRGGSVGRVGPHLADGHRLLPVEHDGRRGDGDHRRRRGRPAARPGARDGGPARARPRLLLRLVRRPDGPPPGVLARRRQAPAPLPPDGGQRLARRRVDHGPQHPPGAAGEGRRPARADGLRLLLRPRRPGRPPQASGADPPGLLDRRPDLREHLRDGQHRAPDRQLPRHRPRPGPARPLLPHLPLPAARTRPAGAGPAGGDADLPGRPRLRVALHLSGDADRPELGREHVRGADGAPAGARGAVGPAELGRQPPALRKGPDRARARRGPLRLLGLLAVQPARRRLSQLRRRRPRRRPRRLHLERRRDEERARAGAPSAPSPTAS